MQKVLTLHTVRDSIRAEVEGWGSEDGDAVRDYWERRRADPSATQYAHINDMPVGCIGGTHQVPYYPTVLHAIGDGWKLLAPPTEYTIQHYEDEDVYGPDTPYDVKRWEWWLVKD